MGGKIRVLTIGHSYVVALNRAVAREVAAHPDFEVTVAAPRFFRGDLRDLHLEPESEGSPLRVVPIDVRWSGIIHLFRYDRHQLGRLLSDGGYDVVHAWEEPYIYAGAQVARALQGDPARFCFWTAQNYSKRLPPPFRRFERDSLRRAQAWVAGGALVYDAMTRRGYPPDAGRVLTLAVDTDAFAPAGDDARRRARDALGLQGPVVGFLGRLTPDKGLRVLMDALDRLGDRRPWSLLAIGSGPMRREILRWADRRGWPGRVRVALARHDEVPAHLAAMDLLAAPSQTTRRWREQFGRMLIEAFACGVPVLASDSGEIPHVVADAGVVLPERDPDAWADAIAELLDDPQRRAELALKGLRRCQLYSTRTLAGQYRDFYRWLAGRTIA